MDIWSWISELPFISTDEWSESNPLFLPLTTPKPTTNFNKNDSTRSIQLRADKSSGPNSEPFLTLSVCSSSPSDQLSTLWISDTCPVSSNHHQPFLPIILQLLHEIVSYSPNGHDTTTCPPSELRKIKPDPISWILESHSPESFSNLFNLIFLTRLFWICAFDAPSEIGSLYFLSLLAPNLESFSCKNSPVMKTFFINVGADVELCFVRTFGYMVAKHLILQELGGAGLKSLVASTQNLGVSYAMESHGLWILKGFYPIYAMNCIWKNGGNSKNQYCLIEAKEAVLKYALAHQHLEVVIQFEYTVQFFEGYIQVRCRLDNIRIHVLKLGFKNGQTDLIMDERHFPSRVRVWAGPELGSNYVSAVSLGHYTDNTEKEIEVQKVMKGSFGKLKVPKVKAMARMATKTKVKNWRWDQDVEGNAVIFDAILCDNTTGIEIATWKPTIGSVRSQLGDNFGRRYSGASRAFGKSGGVVFGGAECGGDGVGWRLNKEMEGSVLKWRIGGKVWLTYLPNDVNSSYMETRCVELCDEVDLPLIPAKYNL